MLNFLSSNVILGKARTMYGRRLTGSDYEELLKCRNINEVAGYLKSHTVYKKVFSDIPESGARRGELEVRLKQKVMDEYASLCKYEIEVDHSFSRILIEWEEIQYLLRAVLSLNSGIHKSSDFHSPAFLRHNSCLDLQALARARTVDGLKQAVSRTPYEKLLEPFLAEEGRIDYTALESVLFGHLFSKLLKTVKNHFSGGTQKELRTIIESYLDLSNYVRIVRMKVMYGANAETTRKVLLPSGNVGKMSLERMLHASTEEEISSIMRKTSIGQIALKEPASYLDQIPRRINYKICRHEMDFSLYPVVVLVSYLILSILEIDNIITIIEGKRYQLAPEEIRKLLIGLPASGMASGFDAEKVRKE